MSKYGVFSGPYFPTFGQNTEKYGVLDYESTKFSAVSTIHKYLNFYPEMSFSEEVLKFCRLPVGTQSLPQTEMRMY